MNDQGKAIVFVGPSLAWPATPPPAVEFRPPAQAGDVYLACLEMPTAIGLIDGYFGGVPSVRHKELLWAMSLGIPVIGASSMGALRAVELLPFRMRGVGRVFEMLRDGAIEDDDEVAVAHAPAEMRYQTLSLPMVELRVTLDNAVRRGVMSDHSAKDIAHAIKRLFYPLRTRQALASAVLACGHDESVVQWLSDNWIAQKTLDAQTLLDAVCAEAASQSNAPVEPIVFRQTTFSDRARFEAVQRLSPTASSQSPAIQHALNELRLDVRFFQKVRSEVELRLFASRNMASCTEGRDLERGRTLPAAVPVRAAIRQWAALDDALCRARQASAYEVVAALPSYLVASGTFAELRRRMAHRASIIRSARIGSDEVLQAQELDEAALLGWFLRRNEVDPGLSWEDLSAILCMHDVEECKELVRADHAFVHLSLRSKGT